MLFIASEAMPPKPSLVWKLPKPAGKGKGHVFIGELQTLEGPPIWIWQGPCPYLPIRSWRSSMNYLAAKRTQVALPGREFELPNSGTMWIHVVPLFDQSNKSFINKSSLCGSAARLQTCNKDWTHWNAVTSWLTSCNISMISNLWDSAQPQKPWAGIEGKQSMRRAGICRGPQQSNILKKSRDLLCRTVTLFVPLTICRSEKSSESETWRCWASHSLPSSPQPASQIFRVPGVRLCPSRVAGWKDKHQIIRRLCLKPLVTRPDSMLFTSRNPLQFFPGWHGSIDVIPPASWISKKLQTMSGIADELLQLPQRVLFILTVSACRHDNLLENQLQMWNLHETLGTYQSSMFSLLRLEETCTTTQKCLHVLAKSLCAQL